MRVEFEQPVAFSNDLRSTKLVHERLQRFLHFEDHARAARGDRRHIAAELNRIAQSLFAMEQDRLVSDRLAAPERLREHAVGEDHRFLHPAPFVVGPAAGEIAAQQPQGRRVAMRHDVAGLQGQRAVVARQRFVEPIGPFQGVAPIGERLGEVRPHRERAIVTRQRFLASIQRQQRIAAVAERIGMVRLQGQSAIIICQRRRALA
jgi:hypothetical protein